VKIEAFVSNEDMGFTVAAVVFLALLALVLAGVAIGTYNALVALRTQVDRAWANIDVILKQRFDEVPQLLQVVEQYAQYEKGIVDRVATARERYGAARSTGEKVVAAQDFSRALQGVIAIGEAYPDLKANPSFVQLQSRLSALESQIADRRETFNDAVTNLNTRIAQFPDLFFAGILGYRAMELFKVTEEERTRPNLKMKLG